MLDQLVSSKFRRPRKLSDPYNDFTNEMLTRLLRLKDDEFGWCELSHLFGPHLPAGTYDEVMYFLPRAFSCLKEREDDALSLVTAVFGFCSKNIKNLNRDRLDLLVMEEIRTCLEFWIRDFRVEHFDRQMCKAKGWGRKYFDYVYNSETLCEAITDLTRFEVLSSIATDFVRGLAHHDGDIVKASWFLELSRSRYDVRTPSENLEILSILSNRDLLLNAYVVIWTEVSEYMPTYWRDTFKKLGL